MYAKIFRQIYDGTLAEDWQSLVTFQQLLILADHYGQIDMTIAAIHRITNIPIDIIQNGIWKLEAPDPKSRSNVADGRRIERLDAERDWGWRIVNHNYYRSLQSKEDKREKDRIRIAEKRNKNKVLTQEQTDVANLSQNVANVAYTDTDTNTDINTDIKKKKIPCRKAEKPSDPNIKIFLEYAKQTFLSIKKEPLHIDWGKDGAITKSLLGTYGLEKLKALWDKFLSSQDEWILKSGFSIGVFKSVINKLVSGGGQIDDKRWDFLKRDKATGSSI